MVNSSLSRRVGNLLPSGVQSVHQWFNFWLLFFCQLSVELCSFPFYENPISQFPRFLVVQLILILGWHSFFVILSRLLGHIWMPLAKCIDVLETIIVIVVFLIEGYLLITYHTNLTDSLCAIIFATTARESREFVGSLASVQLLYVVGVFFLFCILAKTLSIRCVKFSRVLWVRCVFLAACLCMLALTVVKAKRCYQSDSPTPASVCNGIDRMIWSPQVALRVHRKIGNEVDQLLSPKHLEKMSVSSPFESPVDIVVVLGETARADYHSAYGFTQPTTPKLDSLIEEGDAFCFNDARCAANNTVSSGKYIFTFWNGIATRNWCDFPDLLSTFAKAGYATRWFTNQETEGNFSIERIFGRAAQQLRTPHGATGGVVAPIGYDEEVLPILKSYADLSVQEKAKAPSGQFTVVHLMGSHYQYIARYPQHFKHFESKDVPNKKGEPADSRVAEYMNSIRYTDYILGALYALYRERPALIVYLSDHGESLYDNPDQPDLCGHGGRPCLEQADVPFVVMLTPSFRSSYPELSKQLHEARYRPISTAWLTNTLTLTAGIRTRYSDERYNFFGEKFNPPTERTTHGEGGNFSFPPVKEKRVK